MEPLRYSIVWRGAPIAVKDEPLPLIPPGYVLLRVRYGLWSGVEEAARSSYLVPDYGIVMGFSGAGVPIEAAAATPPAGRLLAPTRVKAEWLPGLRSDGWATSYTVAPVEALDEAPESPLAALSLPFSLACEALKALQEAGAASLLVAGGGVFGFTVANAAALRGYRVALWSYKKLRCVNGCTVQRSPPSGVFDAAVVASPSAWVAEGAAKRAEELVLLHPAAGLPRVWQGRLKTLSGEGRGCWRRLLGEVGRLVEKYLRVVGSLEPPPDLGDALGVVFRLG